MSETERYPLPPELRERLERDDPELLASLNAGSQPDPHCPACRGETTGEWMDLCDDHLSAWIAPALHQSRGAVS